jgi:hypothetical protein
MLELFSEHYTSAMSNPIAEHRSRMRKNALLVVGGLYALVMLGPMGQLFSAWRLGGSHRTTEATIKHSSSDRKGNEWTSTYEFSVDGKTYSGTMKSGGKPSDGSKLSIFYAPDSPSLNGVQPPNAAQESAKMSMVALTFGYGFMALLAMGLVSLTSPPGGVQPRPQPPGDPGLSRR